MPHWHTSTLPVLVALAGLVATALLTAGLIRVLFPLLRRYALARPNARSSHTIPTPQGGGIAVVATTLLVAAGAATWVGIAPWPHEQLLVVVASTAMLAVVGLIDDIRPIPPGPRLLLQAVAVAAVTATLPGPVDLLPAIPDPIERTALGLGLLWFVNLVNFMDGIDWMTVATVVPITGGLLVLAQLGALPPPGGVVALALLGATLGFAPFNKPVARLFLGDVGSLPIGLLIGWLLITLAARGHVAAALLLPLYYVTDATLTLLRRLAHGERVWEAHKTHFYQRAVTRGMSVRQVIGRVFATNTALVVAAVITVLADQTAVSLAATLAGAAAVTALLVDLAGSLRAATPSRPPC
ncbi:MraY family glycosyltransferase [Rhodoplanes azumiensis]|uniref:Glycosyltransferase family 4 protein n=1 Tax=Rhodoplanes azumiensis TaxID=1897628 RepID=A0ABW5AHD6_9BRAD